MTAAAVSDAAGAAAASVHAHPVYDSAYNGHNHRTGDSPAAAEDEEEGAADVKGLAHPKLPNVEVRYDFSVNVPVPPSGAAELPSVVGTLLGPLYTTYRAVQRKRAGVQPPTVELVPILTGCHGALCVLKPSTLTLILACPGHGKSTLLRALAGQVSAASVSGTITYGGESAAQLAARGVNLGLLSYYVDQNDVHLPFLTVRETVGFAAALSTVEPKHLGHPGLESAALSRAERVIRSLHLTLCADTLLGNAAVRGVSGGERKRVSIAEALVSNARLLCLDEISTGLDASVTHDIIGSVRRWARSQRGTAVVSLQQATPEVYALFDDVLLLREGATVYHGRRGALPAYLAARGFVPRPTEEIADYCLDLLTSPTTTVLRRLKSGAVPGAPAPALPGGTLRSTAELAEAWREEEARAGAWPPPGQPAPLALESDFAVRQFAVEYPRPLGAAFWLLVWRQSRLSLRNSTVLKARVVVSSVNAIILGLVWYKLGVDQTGAKLGMFVFSLAQMAFANFPETSWVVDYKRTALKQIRQGMYPAWAYTLAGAMLQLPIAAVESAIFCAILYFMSNLEREAGRFFFFWLIVFLTNVAVGALFRALAFVLDSAEAAAAAPGPFIALQLVFAGFLIAPSQMGTHMWMIWMYYTSVFAYGARSLAQNEFLSPSYQIYPSALPTTASLLAAVPGAGSLPGAQYIVAVGEPQAQGAWYFTSPTCGAHPALQCTGHSYGSQALLDLNINLHYEWKWGGVGYLIGFAGLMVAIGTRAVSKKARAPPGRSGSTYSKDAAEAGTDVTTALLAQADRGKLKAEKDRAAAGGGGPGLPTTADASSVLPFQPLSVAWRSLRYTVDTAEGARTLLNGVSGVALPGRLVALMGASGAGKTTLLDVVACRKTAGSVEGEIFAGGYPMEPRSFARATAYCEQQDIHSALATVAEALDFSAALRLPASVSRATRSAFVEEMIDLLELRPLAGRLVGVPEDPASLSPAQRKLLTIAVELVSNAPVLFLDEPTSGLDARAAVVVIRVVRRIASTGRTCVTTVHQPSADVYSNFDDLCLLQRGGYQAWFGPTGPAFEAHLSALPGAHPLPEGMNPASWMLDVLAGVDSSVGTDRPSMDFGGGAPAAAAAAAAVGDGIAPRAEERPQAGPALQEALRASAQWAALESALEGACAPAPGAAPLAAGGAFARAFPAQLGLVLRRAWRSYNRALSYNVARVKILFVLNLLFGTVWYKAQQAVDCAPAQGADKFKCNNTPGGIQSIISIVFINSLFISVINVSSCLPYMLRQRPVYYRERAARMYAPEAHGVAQLLVELPFTLLTVVVVLTPLYFMVGFSSNPEQYFFYLFVVYVCVMSFISLGQTFSAVFSTGAVAQAFLSLILPLCAVFAGVYLPLPQIPNGTDNGHPGLFLRWVYYINPVAHSVEAIGATRFADPSRPSTVNHKIVITQGSSSHTVDAQAFYLASHGASYSNRWKNVGYLFALGGGLQLLYQIINRRVVHVTR